ncbi:hypothetical protein SUGI_0627830 [Cryptomeria japonica]|nr:hypothetical protein SUGI_0627830 [Cryptomeria japonica]
MGCVIETLCGHTFGAGKIQMLGVYLQCSRLILLGTAVLLSFICIFATPVLKLLGQENDVADLAGEYAFWMLPQLFAYVLLLPMQKFLLSQRKFMAMAFIALAAVIIHAFHDSVPLICSHELWAYSIFEVCVWPSAYR